MNNQQLGDYYRIISNEFFHISGQTRANLQCNYARITFTIHNVNLKIYKDDLICTSFRKRTEAE